MDARQGKKQTRAEAGVEVGQGMGLHGAGAGGATGPLAPALMPRLLGLPLGTWAGGTGSVTSANVGARPLHIPGIIPGSFKEPLEMRISCHIFMYACSAVYACKQAWTRDSIFACIEA